MASDSFADFPVTKLRTAGGSIFGGCGTLVGMAKFFRWVDEGQPKKKPKHKSDADFWILELNKDGLFLWENAYIRYRIERGCFAIGAGGQAANALMMKAGMSPEEAVDASCDVVPSACARPVDVLRLADVSVATAIKGAGKKKVRA